MNIKRIIKNVIQNLRGALAAVLMLLCSYLWRWNYFRAVMGTIQQKRWPEIYKKFYSYNLTSGEYKTIALYGENLTRKSIFNIMVSNFGKKVKFLVTDDGSKDIGKYISGYKILALAELPSITDVLIITEEKNHFANHGILKRKYGHFARIVDPYKITAFVETDHIVIKRHDYDHTENEWNEMVSDELIIQEINEYVDKVKSAVDSPLFECIEIETINRCNGVCQFCPVNKNLDPRKMMLMDMDLYKNIIDQLSDLNYSGFVGLYSNNEPLLDNSIVERAKYAYERLPNAHKHIYTNGTLFTIDTFKDLMQYLDEMVIDNYTQNLELIKPCEEIKAYVEQHPELRRKVTITLCKPDEILSSRGGDAPNRKDILSLGDVKCVAPFRQMVVRPDGKLSLCCNDAMGKCTLGDLTKQSILDAWYGTEYQKIRGAISRGRKYIPQCEKCDTVYGFGMVNRVE